jgi:L-seryl-tRNA(Ser) seleniumtransferase
MRCHTSNFRIVGFTESPTTAELVSLASTRNLPFVDDIGSGALLDLAPFGIRGEPLAKESLAAGADVVLFSGDKLLGGPQCGILVGRKKYVDAMGQHPMMRALRVGKMTLAALAATLELYRDQSQAKEKIPFLRLLTTSVENLENRARRLAPQLASAKAVKSAEAIESQSQLGGGSVPAQTIPTWCIALTPDGIAVDDLARRLRISPSPVYGRIQNDRLLLDLRTVFASQDMQLVAALEAVET